MRSPRSGPPGAVAAAWAGTNVVEHSAQPGRRKADPGVGRSVIHANLIADFVADPAARPAAGRRVCHHLQLRRRGIDTILLAGISTNVGVESTARDAYERGYEQVFVEDAMAARSPDEHANTVRTVFPRIGRVLSTAEVLAALEVATRQA
jgi:Isochorismatase family